MRTRWNLTGILRRIDHLSDFMFHNDRKQQILRYLRNYLNSNKRVSPPPKKQTNFFNPQ